MAEGFTKALRNEIQSEIKSAGPMTLPLMSKALAQFKAEFDEKNHGFGTVTPGISTFHPPSAWTRRG